MSDRGLAQRNLERARLAFDAFNRDGAQSLFDLLDPSIVWIADRADAGRVTSHGVEGVRRSFEEQFEAVSNLQFESARCERWTIAWSPWAT
jgi:hypothetical protein